MRKRVRPLREGKPNQSRTFSSHPLPLFLERYSGQNPKNTQQKKQNELIVKKSLAYRHNVTTLTRTSIREPLIRLIVQTSLREIQLLLILKTFAPGTVWLHLLQPNNAYRHNVSLRNPCRFL